ncbi:MAG: hypothetical protein KBF45_12615 [Cyclobacteriaceae bacterium]|jgi:hypothetical protein|nr:hypothetical protein [Cyclobacteriaceae bacterium]
MNTKWIMIATSLLLGVSGIVLTFAPDLIIGSLGVNPSQASILLGQILGALYFGFAMLNWMTKESLIGGIYNRPVAVANLTHFMIAGLALVKASISNPQLPLLLILVSGVYTVLAILFGIILFRHPIPEK